MKCEKCGVDIYEGIKKCPYCKTPTGAGTDDKFRNFDFKYTIDSSEQAKIIEEAARTSGKPNNSSKKSKMSDLKKLVKLPKIAAAKPQAKTEEKKVSSPDEIDAKVRAKEIAKTASQRAAEFVPEGRSRYTIRNTSGEKVDSVWEKSGGNNQEKVEPETLNAYTRIQRIPQPKVSVRKPRTRRRMKNNKGILALFAAGLCAIALVVGIFALLGSIFSGPDEVMTYTYAKGNSLHQIYKGKASLITENLVSDSYIRNVAEAGVGPSAARAAKNAGITKVTKDGKRTYFFDEFDPETGSGILKYVNKGKTKKAKEISQAVHNSLVMSKDGKSLLFLKATDKNGDMGVLCYWNDKMEKPFEIATDIDHDTFTFAGEDQWAIFIQNFNRVAMQGDLCVQNLKNTDEEKLKIDSEVCALYGTNPGKAAYIYAKNFDSSDKTFDIYAINKKGRQIRLGERTKKAPLMQKTKDSLFVYGLDDDGTSNLYTVDIDSGKKEKIASNMNSILMLSKDEKTVIYDKVYGGIADYYAYTKGKQPQMVASNVVVDYNAVAGKPQMAVSQDSSKILYISEFESFKGGGTLKMTTYKKGQIVDEVQIAENVYMCFRAKDGKFIIAKDYSPSRKVFDVYLLDGTDLKLLKEEIKPDMLQIAQDEDAVLCITNMGIEGSFGTLESINLKGEATIVAEEVFGFDVSKEDLLIYKNLNKDDGSFDIQLKKGNRKKLVDIDTAISEILSY